MVDNDLGGWTLDNDGSGTVDKDFTLVVGISDRRADAVASGVLGGIRKVVVAAIGGSGNIGSVGGISGSGGTGSASISGIAKTVVEVTSVTAGGGSGTGISNGSLLAIVAGCIVAGGSSHCNQCNGEGGYEEFHLCAVSLVTKCC